MNLWLSSHFLLAGLFLSSWALTPEECHPLVTPLSLADHSMMYGRWTFIAAFTDHEVYNALLKISQSSWMNVIESKSNPNQFEISQADMTNGTCVSSHVNMIADGNTLSVSIADISSSFHLLPTCDNCLLFYGNRTARNLDKVLQMMKINIDIKEDEITAHAVYLMARESTLKDSDMEHFKQQASCLGFSGEPDFVYDPKNGFCAEGEGIDLTSANLRLSSRALTPEECQPLVTPLSLADHSMMYGRWTFIAAYTDHEVYDALLKISQSSWMNVIESKSNPNQFEISQADMMNGTCVSSHVNMIADGNTLSVSIANISSSFHLLPTCDNCLLFYGNSTARNIDKVLQMMKINTDIKEDEITARAVYLMARESTLKDSDMEHFKQQASCLGFSGEPDFVYDPKNGFCAEGEGIDLTSALS